MAKHIHHSLAALLFVAKWKSFAIKSQLKLSLYVKIALPVLVQNHDSKSLFLVLCRILFLFDAMIYDESYIFNR